MCQVNGKQNPLSLRPGGSRHPGNPAKRLLGPIPGRRKGCIRPAAYPVPQDMIVHTSSAESTAPFDTNGIMIPVTFQFGLNAKLISSNQVVLFCYFINPAMRQPSIYPHIFRCIYQVCIL
jgi:hypothetical protein